MIKDRRQTTYFYTMIDIGTVCLLFFFVKYQRLSVALVIGMLFMHLLVCFLQMYANRKKLKVYRVVGMSRYDFVYERLLNTTLLFFTTMVLIGGIQVFFSIFMTQLWLIGVEIILILYLLKLLLLLLFVRGYL